MKIQSGKSQAQSPQRTERTERSTLQKSPQSQGAPARQGLRDSFSASTAHSTARATAAARLQGQVDPPRIDINETIGTVARGAQVIGAHIGEASDGICHIRQDITRSEGTIIGAIVDGNLTRCTLTIEQNVGTDTGKTTAAQIGGNVVDSVIVANGKVTVDGNVSGSIIVVNDPSDLVVKGKISPDTKIMTPAQYEQYKREHKLPEAGTR